MKKIILFVAGIGLLASCSKNVKSDTPIDASKSKMLMDGAWQLKAYMINPDINDSLSIPQDAYTPLPGCVKDNFYVFHNAGVLVQYEGYHKCTLSDPDSVALLYQLSNNETHLRVWSNPDDPEHSVLFDGNMAYPSVDSFILDFQTYDSAADMTSEHTLTYVKMQ